MNGMTDLSFTQTFRAMASKPVSRAERSYKPWWVIAAEHNKKPKVLIDRRAKGWKIQPNVFMGC